MSGPPSDHAHCPCGRPSTYADCCGRFIDGHALPATAEDLMRSRYCAYTRQAIDYLIATHHPDTRSGDRRSLERWARRAQWLGLDVLDCEAGGPNDERGIVEFRCRFFDGDTHVHHERSSFVRQDGRWLYVNGTFVEPGPATASSRAKVGRNEPCPCGSGNKFKRCCLAAGH